MLTNSHSPAHSQAFELPGGFMPWSGAPAARFSKFNSILYIGSVFKERRSIFPPGLLHFNNKDIAGPDIFHKVVVPVAIVILLA